MQARSKDERNPISLQNTGPDMANHLSKRADTLGAEVTEVIVRCDLRHCKIISSIAAAVIRGDGQVGSQAAEPGPAHEINRDGSTVGGRYHLHSTVCSRSISSERVSQDGIRLSRRFCWNEIQSFTSECALGGDFRAPLAETVATCAADPGWTTCSLGSCLPGTRTLEGWRFPAVDRRREVLAGICWSLGLNLFPQ